MKAWATQIFRITLRALVGIFLATLVIGSQTMAMAAGKGEAQSIVDKSKGTLSDLLADENFSWLHSYIKSARGVIIFPQILKAGFILGGSGGTGVLLVRDGATGNWSEPAFYTLGSVTFGLQIGGEAAEVVMLAMNQKAVDSLLTSSVKLGGDLSVALGPVGGGAKGALTVPAVTADFLSFAKTKGLYAGLNLEGSVLDVRDSLNQAYYGKGMSQKDILIRHDVGNPGAAELRALLAKAAGR